MSKPRYQVAQIHQNSYEVGFFGGVFRTIVYAEKTTMMGTVKIAQSREFVWRKSDHQTRHHFVEESIDKQYQQVLQALLEEGWEPIGTDSKGRVTTLKKLDHESSKHTSHYDDFLQQLISAYDPIAIATEGDRVMDEPSVDSDVTFGVDRSPD